MPRPVILCSAPWADLPLEELAGRAAEWGYQGLDLCCWGDHLEVQRALGEDDYCPNKLALLGRHDLTVAAISCHRVGQAIGDLPDGRHRRLLPDYVWGDGSAEGVRQRAAEEVLAVVQAAQKLGVNVLSTFTGSTLWPLAAGQPPAEADDLSAAFADFAQHWGPILDSCREAGIRLAMEVCPGQIAFDLPSAEMALAAVDGREELGFTFDPAHLHWQGVDPIEFLRRFPDRIYHVHVKDVALTLNGRSSLLGAYLPDGDSRRGWQYRAPGHGGLDWEGIIRGLNEIGYEGSLAVDWRDAGMNRDHGAEEACRFVKRLDFEPGPRQGDGAFREV
jgi:sugar phosphate isomerase/epimerase